MEVRLDRPEEGPLRLGLPRAISGRFGRTPRPPPPIASVASIAPNLSSRAWQARACGPLKFFQCRGCRNDKETRPKDSSPRRDKRASASGPTKANRSVRETEPDCHHDPDRAPASPHINEASDLRPSTCPRTRRTSILAFGSGSRASRLLRRSLYLWSPISLSSSSSSDSSQATAESRKPVPTSS